jgi:hypothetical protein
MRKLDRQRHERREKVAGTSADDANRTLRQLIFYQTDWKT